MIPNMRVEEEEGHRKKSKHSAEKPKNKNK